MIALDTNVLVRFLVEDDAVQAAKATALIERRPQRRRVQAPGPAIRQLVELRHDLR